MSDGATGFTVATVAWTYDGSAWQPVPDASEIAYESVLVDPPCTTHDAVYYSTIRFWRTAVDLGTYGYYTTDSNEYSTLPPNKAFWVDSDGPVIAVLAPTDLYGVGPPTTPVYVTDTSGNFRALPGYGSGGALRVSVRYDSALIGVGNGPTDLIQTTSGKKIWSTDQPVWLWPAEIPMPGEARNGNGPYYPE